MKMLRIISHWSGKNWLSLIAIIISITSLYVTFSFQKKQTIQWAELNRPRFMLDEVKLLEEQINEKKKTKFHKMLLKFRNVGSLPAKNVTIYVDPLLDIDVDKPSPHIGVSGLPIKEVIAGQTILLPYELNSSLNTPIYLRVRPNIKYEYDKRKFKQEWLLRYRPKEKYFEHQQQS